MLTISRKRFEGDVPTYFDLMVKVFEGESERPIGIVSVCILKNNIMVEQSPRSLLTFNKL